MDEWQARTYGLIQAHLDAAVPLLIRELLEEGGPTDYHYQLVREHGRYLAEHGDAILYPQKGTTSEAMNRLVEGVAILAFCPGGIRLFGCEFDARRMPVPSKASQRDDTRASSSGTCGQREN